MVLCALNRCISETLPDKSFFRTSGARFSSTGGSQTQPGLLPALLLGDELGRKLIARMGDIRHVGDEHGV